MLNYIIYGSNSFYIKKSSAKKHYICSVRLIFKSLVVLKLVGLSKTKK